MGPSRGRVKSLREDSRALRNGQFPYWGAMGSWQFRFGLRVGSDRQFCTGAQRMTAKTSGNRVCGHRLIFPGTSFRAAAFGAAARVCDNEPPPAALSLPLSLPLSQSLSPCFSFSCFYCLRRRHSPRAVRPTTPTIPARRALSTGKSILATCLFFTATSRCRILPTSTSISGLATGFSLLTKMPGCAYRIRGPRRNLAGRSLGWDNRIRA